MKIKIYYIALLLTFSLLLSCGSAEDNTIINQDTLIEQFITTLKSDSLFKYVDYANGVSHVVFEKGDEHFSVGYGDSVYFYYSAGVITSGSTFFLYDTNIIDYAREMGLDTTIRSFNPKGEVVGKGNLIKGLDLGLQMCKWQEVRYILFNSDLGYGSEPLGLIPAYSPIMYYVYIDGVKKN